MNSKKGNKVPENHLKAQEIRQGDMLWLPSVFNGDKVGIMKVKPGMVSFSSNKGNQTTVRFTPFWGDHMNTSPLGFEVQVVLPSQSTWEKVLVESGKGPEPWPDSTSGSASSSCGL